MEMEQSLTTEYEVQLILICGRPELSQCAIADKFNNKHPDDPLSSLSLSDCWAPV
jgi:hypothetical protein